MQIESRTVDGVTVIAIEGDIDGKTAPIAQEQVLPLVKASPKTVIDMTKLAYMSSAGMRMLLSVRRQVQAGGAIVLVGMSEQIRDTMNMTGFLDFFATAETLEEGLAAVG